MIDTRKSWIVLSLIPRLGEGRLGRLISHFGSPDNVLNASFKELLEIEGIDKNIAEGILYHGKNNKNVEKELELIKRHKVEIITIQDKEYPLNLKFIFNPPLILYVKGTLIPEDNISVAIVGSRRATDYGKMVTERLSGELAQKGITIVSGLARGIDTYAHKGALNNGKRTIAVLGSGLDVIYPPENKNIFEKIVKNGAVISEFPMGTKPERENFPIRNRIISGLTLGTVVVEAAEKSGSLITACYALEQGREVFAIPGSVYSRYSKGTHELIKQGAKLTENIEDIIQEIDSFKKMFVDSNRISLDNNQDMTLSNDEKTVYNIITYEPVHIDQVSLMSKIGTNILASVLIGLEMKGRIKQLSGKRFVRI